MDRDGRQQQFAAGYDYKTIDYDENGMPIVKKKEQYFVPDAGYETVGYDENGTKIIRKKDESSDINNAELIDQTYDTVIDGITIANETNNVIMPKYIKDQPRPNNIGQGTWNKQITKELAEQTKFYSKAGKVLEKLGYIGIGVDVAVGVYKNIEAGTSWQRTVTDAVVDLTISLFIAVIAVPIAAILAAVIGAVIGALVGLAFGGEIGAAVGAMLGSEISIAIISIIVAYGLDYFFNQWTGYNGKTINEQMKEVMWSNVNWLENFFDGIAGCCD